MNKKLLKSFFEDRSLFICGFTYIHIIKKQIKIRMANLTFSISNKLKKSMEDFPEIHWSEVVRDSIRRKIAQLDFLKGFRIDSEISPEDALSLGREINELLLKHYQKN